MDRARTFIHTHLLKDVEDKSLFYDAKTILQEMVQAGPDPRLEYVLTREAGPDHNKEFTVEAKIGGKTYAIGKGKTKRSRADCRLSDDTVVKKAAEVVCI